MPTQPGLTPYSKEREPFSLAYLPCLGLEQHKIRPQANMVAISVVAISS